MSKVSTSERDIIKSRESLNHNEREFDSFVNAAERDIEGCRDRANGVLSALEKKLNSAQTKLTTLQERLSKVQNRLSQAERELAQCRPPREVTVTYTDSDGNVHTYTYIEDPDGPKREALQAEIADLENKQLILEQSIREFQIYILELEKGINQVKQAFPHINNAGDELERIEPNVREKFEDMEGALDDVDEAIDSYNSVNIHGSSEIGMEPLPYFHYESGSLITTILDRPRGGSVAPSGPTEVTIIFDQIVNSEVEFRKEIQSIIDKNHCKITLKVHKALTNFKYSTNLNQIRNSLKTFKFLQQKNLIGTYMVTVDGYYVFERMA